MHYGHAATYRNHIAGYLIMYSLIENIVGKVIISGAGYIQCCNDFI